MVKAAAKPNRINPKTAGLCPYLPQCKSRYCCSRHCHAEGIPANRQTRIKPGNIRSCSQRHPPVQRAPDDTAHSRCSGTTPSNCRWSTPRISPTNAGTPGTTGSSTRLPASRTRRSRQAQRQGAANWALNRRGNNRSRPPGASSKTTGAKAPPPCAGCNPPPLPDTALKPRSAQGF